MTLFLEPAALIERAKDVLNAIPGRCTDILQKQEKLTALISTAEPPKTHPVVSDARKRCEMMVETLRSQLNAMEHVRHQLGVLTAELDERMQLATEELNEAMTAYSAQRTSQ